jgi:hypothetical protein
MRKYSCARDGGRRNGNGVWRGVGKACGEAPQTLVVPAKAATSGMSGNVFPVHFAIERRKAKLAHVLGNQSLARSISEQALDGLRGQRFCIRRR